MLANPSPVVKANGAGSLATYSLLRGRIGDLQRYAAQARQIAQTLGQPPNPFVDSIQQSQLDLGFFDDTIRAVRRMDAMLANANFSAVQFDQRPYLGIAAFYANAGQPAKAKTWMARWEAEVPDSTLRRTLEPGRRGVQGAIALAEGRYADAIRDIWAADSTYDGPSGNCAMCIYDDLAFVHARAGAADSAIYWYERYLREEFYGRFNFEGGAKPIMLKRLGELYERVGNVEKAALTYREFLSLWDKADPRLQPKVAEVRQALSRLANVERR
jgi:hypothetical protein